MTARAAAAVGLALLAAPASAGPGVPGADYFRGLYERVGREGGDRPRLFDDHVRIVPDGTNLSVTSCDAPPLRLVFDPWSEIVNLLAGEDADGPLWCLFHNNGDNYPILTCRSAAGGAWTLWPVEDGFSDAPLDCGG
jgi:hypothetical protein